jgi:hypothetical protein
MFSLIFTLLVYGTLPLVVAGLIICWYWMRPQPTITSDYASLGSSYSDDELTALAALQHMQFTLQEQKAQIYSHGDQLGLSRRQSDGRFDARGSGRLLNSRLARLDGHFEAIEDEMLSIHMGERNRCQEKWDEYIKWRPRYSLFVAFRNGAVVYVVTLGAILALNVYFPVFSSLFSSAIIPCASAIGLKPEGERRRTLSQIGKHRL